MADNVYEFKRPDKKKAVEPPRGPTTKPAIDAVQALFNAVDEKEGDSKLLRIRMHINGLKGRVNQENIALQREMFQKLHSTEDLKRIIDESGELDWKARPSYYLAAIDEYASRRNEKE